MKKVTIAMYNAHTCAVHIPIDLGAGSGLKRHIAQGA